MRPRSCAGFTGRLEKRRLRKIIGKEPPDLPGSRDILRHRTSGDSYRDVDAGGSSDRSPELSRYSLASSSSGHAGKERDVTDELLDAGLVFGGEICVLRDLARDGAGTFGRNHSNEDWQTKH